MIVEINLKENADISYVLNSTSRKGNTYLLTTKNRNIELRYLL